MELSTLPSDDTRSTDRITVAPAAAAVGGVVVAVVLAVWLLALTLTGSPVGDVFRWVGAVLTGVLAPGFALVRAGRRATAPLIEDLAWAAPAGCLVALLGWFGDRVLPWSPAPYVVGPAVVLLMLLIPATRRRVLARPAPKWGRGPTIVLGVVLLVAVGWMVSTGLRAYRPDPGPHGTAFYPDVLYQLMLLGELRHTLVPTYPPVAGTSLSYHWFLYAILAHLGTGTGLDPFDSTLRLAPATLVPAILMLTAVVARRLSGRIWAGPLAAVLFGVVDISVASRWSTEDGSIGVLPRIWRSSPPQTLGWLASLAAAGLLIAFLRRSRDDRAVPVVLLLPVLILTAGSKSSELPVLMAGVALAGGVALLRRDWTVLRRCVVAVALGIAVVVVATLTIYGSSSYGVKPQLFGTALARMGSMFPGQPGMRTSPLVLSGTRLAIVPIVTITAVFLLPLLPRLLGLVFQVRYRVADPAGWLCLGTAVAGLLVPFVIRHPSGSELYFLLSAYPIGVVGAAGGLILAADRVRAAVPAGRARTRLAAWFGALVVVGALAAAAVAHAQPHLNPIQRWARTHPADPYAESITAHRLAWLWAKPDVTLLAVLGVLALVVLVVVRSRRPDRVRRDTDPAPRRRAPLVWLSLTVLLLGTGLFATTLEFGGTDTPVQGSVAAVHPSTAGLLAAGLLPTMRDGVAAGHWVDRHAGPDDVVATNLYCRYTRAVRARRGTVCDARNFAATAFTQRRTLVGGWAYADRVLDDAWSMTTAYRNAPFWDPALLRQQDEAIAHPTPARLAALYRDRHVRWIYADLRDGPVDIAGLDRFAVSRFRGPSTGVWQLRRPA